MPTENLQTKKIFSGVASLFFIQISATLGFAILYSSLVLFATKKLGLTESEANTTMGIFAAFNYGLHLFGGYLGGRFLSNRSLFLIGVLLQLLGCVFIAIDYQAFLWGLAFFLEGSGLNVTCINMMLTQRFSPEDDRRESAFFWNYAGMNMGFFIGFTLAGVFQLQENFTNLFIAAALGSLITVIITAICWSSLADISTELAGKTSKEKHSRMLVSLVILVILVLLLRLILDKSAVSSYVIIGLSIAAFIYLCYITYSHTHVGEQKRMYAYLILFISAIVFFSLYQLAPMGLVLFIEHNVDLNMMGYTIAPQWIQNINTVTIVIGGPLLAWLFNHCRSHYHWKIDIPLQFSLALLAMALGMLILPLGIELVADNGLVEFQWIFYSYILQSLGELLLAPVGYAMIGKLAPTRYQGIMMGCWMLVNSIGALLASYISNMMPKNIGVTPLQSNLGYSQVFMWLGIVSLGIAIILLCLIPKLRQLIDFAVVDNKNS